ncbi:hypothetical protein AB2T90_11270 [Clostridium butyricum]|uniref:hypothetical protein n=1 Tax=Clostridium butyricum TaxID=1492 RepID=UPI003466E86F
MEKLELLLNELNNTMYDCKEISKKINSNIKDIESNIKDIEDIIKNRKITDFVVKFILENSNKTIKLIDLKRGNYNDKKWDHFYTDWYFNEFINIREKLKCNGFKVIKIE